MTRDELFADATQRKADISAKIAEIQQQMVTLNNHGIEQERALLGVDGELKALTALGESVG